MKRRAPIRRRRCKAQPESIGLLLGRWIKREKMETEIAACEIQRRWPELVGERVAARTRPAALREGVLTLWVASSAWLNELTFLRVDLVRRINEAMGAATVSAIRLLAGPMRPRPPEPVGAAPPVEAAEVPLSSEQLEAIGREVTGVLDPEVRQALRGARIAALRRQLRRPAGEGA